MVYYWFVYQNPVCGKCTWQECIHRHTAVKAQSNLVTLKMPSCFRTEEFLGGAGLEPSPAHPPHGVFFARALPTMCQLVSYK